jgi:hypothetical protein
MRSGKLDLDGVAGRFEAWRANKRGRLIPAVLWRAALSLLDRYTASAICLRLRLGPARFKQVRQAAMAEVAGGSRGRGKGDDRRSLRAPRPQPLPAPVAMIPADRAFVEFPALGVTVTGASGRCEAPSATAAGYRLVLESARGTLILLTRAPDGELVDVVCRFVLGAMGSGGAKP